MSQLESLSFSQSYSEVGTVSYPRKFKDKKFPIINMNMTYYDETINKSTNYLYIVPGYNEFKNFTSWCEDNTGMKKFIQ